MLGYPVGVSGDARRATVDLSIVILNYNTREHLRTCLAVARRRGLDDASGGPIEAEVFVVDNASQRRLGGHGRAPSSRG